MDKKPKTKVVVQLTGISSNVLKLCEVVVKELRMNGYNEYAKDVSKQICGMHSREEALYIFHEYVDTK